MKEKVSLSYNVQSVTMGSQGRSLRQEPGGRTKAEPTEEHCFVVMSLVAHSSWLIQFTFLYNPEPPSQGWYYSQYARPSHINY